MEVVELRGGIKIKVTRTDLIPSRPAHQQPLVLTLILPRYPSCTPSISSPKHSRRIFHSHSRPGDSTTWRLATRILPRKFENASLFVRVNQRLADRTTAGVPVLDLAFVRCDHSARTRRGFDHSTFLSGPPSPLRHRTPPSRNTPRSCNPTQLDSTHHPPPSTPRLAQLAVKPSRHAAMAAVDSNPITSAVPSSSPITSVSPYAPAPPLYSTAGATNPGLLSRLNLDLRGTIFPVDRETLMLLPESVLLGLFPQGLILSKPATEVGGDDGVFTVDVSGSAGIGAM